MKIDTQNYEQMRAWLSHAARHVFPGFPPEADPIRALDSTAATSPANARKGLAMAVGDIVEATDGWSSQKVAELDNVLAAEGLPTMTQTRIAFSKVVERVVRRGRINNEVEYYAIRNVADKPSDKADVLRDLVADLEEGHVP